MANPIRKTTTLAGATIWVVDGRRYNASPARPQFPTKEQAETALAEMIAQPRNVEKCLSCSQTISRPRAAWGWLR